MLPATAGDDSLTVRRHLARCPECRAEAARYESLQRSYAELRSVGAEPPVGLLATLQAIPENGSRLQNVRTHVARNRKAYAGGVAAVMATGLAGAVVWRSRARRVATA
ncbi:MAG: hypothetical protein QOH90_140 [Actinomycetota bacterium]|jgi:anti-sigma factor RsiW|nr:hypothetical protein [Actinomycetota bacterium]